MATGAIELLEQVSLACRDTLTVWPHWQIVMEMKKAVAGAIQKSNAIGQQANSTRNHQFSINDSDIYNGACTSERNPHTSIQDD